MLLKQNQSEIKLRELEKKQLLNAKEEREELLGKEFEKIGIPRILGIGGAGDAWNVEVKDEKFWNFLSAFPLIDRYKLKSSARSYFSGKNLGGKNSIVNALSNPYLVPLWNVVCSCKLNNYVFGAKLQHRFSSYFGAFLHLFTLNGRMLQDLSLRLHKDVFFSTDEFLSMARQMLEIREFHSDNGLWKRDFTHDETVFFVIFDCKDLNSPVQAIFRRVVVNQYYSPRAHLEKILDEKEVENAFISTLDYRLNIVLRNFELKKRK